MEIFGVFLVNQGSGETIPLCSDKENIIGRGVPEPETEGKFMLPHPSVSKMHARIEVAPETQTWILYDLSRHGTIVNGKKMVKEHQLAHGDKIQIGPFTLMFYEKFKADDETSEQPLPMVEQKKEKSLLNMLGAILLVGVLALTFPKYLIVPMASLFFFAFILLIKPGWKKKTKISYKLLFFLTFLALLGALLIYLRLN